MELCNNAGPAIEQTKNPVIMADQPSACIYATLAERHETMTGEKDFRAFSPRMKTYVRSLGIRLLRQTGIIWKLKKAGSLNKSRPSENRRRIVFSSVSRCFISGTWIPASISPEKVDQSSSAGSELNFCYYCESSVEPSGYPATVLFSRRLYYSTRQETIFVWKLFGSRAKIFFVRLFLW